MSPAAGRLGRGLARLLAPASGAILSVATREKRLALTFDDGPDPEFTPRLLDVLARRGARASFFLVGARAARHPDLVARLAAEGHEIGNHGWEHRSLPTLPAREAAAEIARARAALAPHGQRLLRPPYGHQTPATHRLARRQGYRVVLWSLKGNDWQGQDAEAIARKLVARAAPGAIVLLHDSLCAWENARFRDRVPTIEAVERVLERLPDYRFVTVSELLAAGRPVRRYWVSRPDPDWLAGLQTAAP